MSRPLCIQRAGAVCSAWLDHLAHTLQRFDAQALAYCLLPGQYQLMLFTRRANLSGLMRHLNGAR